MKTVYILIGAPGAGKSTFVKSMLTDKSIHLSSDNKRIELFGELSQDDNNLVFNELRNDLVSSLKNENIQTIFWDATNITRKNRKSIYELIKRTNKNTKVVAVCILKTFKTLCKQNAMRPMDQIVPTDVIKKMYIGLQVPKIGLDCDDIVKYNCDDYSLFKQEEIQFGQNIPHNSEWHDETICEHIAMCMQNAGNNDVLFEIAKYHDFGKYFTRELNAKGYHSYKGHDTLSAQYYFVKNVDINNQQYVDIQEVILYHLLAHQGLTEKTIKRYNITERQLDLLTQFEIIDDISRISTKSNKEEREKCMT